MTHSSAKTIKTGMPDRVLLGVKAGSKKQLLQEIAKVAADAAGLHERQVFDILVERERLGSTGMGGGVAIPHARLEGLPRVYEVFAKVDKAVEFEAIDGQPVDLVYLLLAPMEAGADHLKALARASRLLRDQAVCAKLRGSDSAEAIMLVLGSQGEASSAA